MHSRDALRSPSFGETGAASVRMGIKSMDTNLHHCRTSRQKNSKPMPRTCGCISPKQKKVWCAVRSGTGARIDVRSERGRRSRHVRPHTPPGTHSVSQPIRRTAHMLLEAHFRQGTGSSRVKTRADDTLHPVRLVCAVVPSSVHVHRDISVQTTGNVPRSSCLHLSTDSNKRAIPRR